MNENIFYNTLKDWSKKDITPEEKSAYIQDYLQKNKISMRELGRQLNIPHSTLQDWISMRQKDKVAKRKLNELDYLIDRLIFLLNKNDVINEKTERKLTELENEIYKRKMVVKL